MQSDSEVKRSQLHGLILLLISEGKCKISDLPFEYRYLHPEYYYVSRLNAQCNSSDDVAQFCTLLFADYTRMPDQYKELFKSLVATVVRWHNDVIERFNIKTPKIR